MSKNVQIQFNELVFLSVSCESSIIPTYLYSWTIDNILPATVTSGSLSGSLFSVPVAQWLEHCISSAKIVGSIPREHMY